MGRREKRGGVEGTEWREFYMMQSYNITCSLHAITFLNLEIFATWVLKCVVLLLWGFRGVGNYMVKSSGYSRLRSLFYHFLMSWLRLNLRNAIFRLARRTGGFKSDGLGGLLTSVTRSLA